MKMLIIIYLLLFLLKVSAKFNFCSQKESCYDCKRDIGCIWCSRLEFQAERCISTTEESKDFVNQWVARCGKSHIEAAKTWINVTISEEFGTDNDIQLRPQEVDVSLAPGSSVNISIEFKLAENYPLDVYFLLDLSKSMQDDVTTLAVLSEKLIEEMAEITTNFRLGIGTFQDKPVLPYFNTYTLRKCDEECRRSISFQHVLEVTDRHDDFADKIKHLKTNISNIDSPEGGFDGLVQAIQCSEIGWRSKARHFIVLLTDAGFHYAGDGRLAGITKPNDLECHLQDGKYTEYATQDFPSVAQIDFLAQKEKMIIIFAVKEEQLPLYKLLEDNISGSKAGKLAEDSSDIINFIKENYEEISTTVTLESQFQEPLTVRMFSECRNGQEYASCHDVRVGEKVNFEATIILNKCPVNKVSSQKVKIFPVSLPDELNINVKLDCQCSCEKDGVQNSTECNGNGSLVCGVCDCNAGFYGDHCECSLAKGQTVSESYNCRKDNSSLECSNRGNCICGKCKCFSSENKKYWGTYCECDDFSCPTVGGLMCSGKGECNCGRCQCYIGWGEEACQCDMGTTNCRSEGGEICSGHGSCICNKCVCDKIGEFTGRFCQDCPSCKGRCQDLEVCAICLVFSKDKEKCPESCYNINVTQIDIIEENEEGWHYCSVSVDSCRGIYQYKYEENNIAVYIQTTLECIDEINVLVLVLSIVGGIVLMGLLILLVWKCVVDYKDKKDYLKFIKEVQEAQGNFNVTNPLYKPSTTNFANPVYGQ